MLLAGVIPQVASKQAIRNRVPALRLGLQDASPCMTTKHSRRVPRDATEGDRLRSRLTKRRISVAVSGEGEQPTPKHMHTTVLDSRSRYSAVWMTQRASTGILFYSTHHHFPEPAALLVCLVNVNGAAPDHPEDSLF